MQASERYGVPEIPTFVVGRGPSSHSHMFNLSHGIPPSPSARHGQSHGRSPHPQHHLNTEPPQQHQHHHQQQQLHLQHSQHHSQTQQSQHQQQHTSQQSQQPQCQLTTASSQQTQPKHQQHQDSCSQHNQKKSHNQFNPPQLVQQLALSSDPPETPSPVVCRPSPSNNFSKAVVMVADQPLSIAEDHDELAEEGERGIAGTRWPRQETLALLKIRADMDSNFRDSNAKGPLWEEVTRKMAEMGYHRNAKKCKEKFENVHKYYKRTKDGKAGRQDGKSYRFFAQLEALYGNANVPQYVNGTNACNVDIHGGNLVGSGYNNNLQGEKGGFLLSRGCAAAVGGEGSGSASKPDLDYGSGLSFSTESSDDDHEDPGDNPESRKRKRKYSTTFSALFENLVRQILDKQEQMQQKFLEALEQRENDRMIREEAWKRQEMARMNREQELRAQERTLAATRDAALVAFLQKVTGQTLQLPQLVIPAPPSLLTASDGHDDTQVQERDQYFDPNSKRWPKPEVLALIKLRTGMNSSFHEAAPKGPLWEEISAKMASLGYDRSSKRCKEKWENINKYFKKAKESNKRRLENAKTCPYFHQLDALYSKGLLGANKQLIHKVDNHSTMLLEQPSGSKEESRQPQGDCAVLAIMPSGEQAIDGSPKSIAKHFFSTAEIRQNGDRGMEKETVGKLIQVNENFNQESRHI